MESQLQRLEEKINLISSRNFWRNKDKFVVGINKNNNKQLRVSKVGEDLSLYTKDDFIPTNYKQLLILTTLCNKSKYTFTYDKRTDVLRIFKSYLCDLSLNFPNLEAMLTRVEGIEITINGIQFNLQIKKKK